MATRFAPGSGETRLPRPFGKYTLLHRIAKGGMAELYLGLHRSTAGFEKLVVIKRALPLYNHEEEFIAMLLHEARIAATLSHPNIVQIYDVGQIDGTYFIAMEHVHGEDMRAIQRQLAKRGRELPIEHALSVGIGLCSALAYAHAKCDLAGNHLRIVHRDISPHNVLVSYSGDVKLVDFGVAKSRVQLTDQTRSGSIKGKIAYMSPEQALGQSLDARSDIFAIGTTLYELTTGRRLFRGRTDFETLKMVGAAHFAAPRDVRANFPEGLEAIILRALAKYPRDRYQSAGELQYDLERFLHVSHLHTSALTVSAFMRDLFADKLRDQEKVLASVKRIADSALIHTPEAFAAEPMPSGPSSAPPGAASVSDVSRVEPRGGLGWLVFAVAIAAFVFAVSSGQQWQEVSVAKGQWFTFDDGSDGKAASAARAEDPPAPVTGKLTVSASGSGCQVQVDGKSAGHSPLVDFVLSAGQHGIGCTPSAGRAFSVNVRIDPGETAHVGFVLP
jgi:serine/threonine-protein kinase